LKRYLNISLAILVAALFFSCSDSGKEEGSEIDYNEKVEHIPQKDFEIQKYNIELKKKQSSNRTECDTIALLEYVLNNYPEGTYVVEVDKKLTYDIPRSAVIYYNDAGEYIFTVIAKSKPGERLIEPKNIVGYDQSFIDLDSTKLGTAFFYLTLFKCNDGKFQMIWEAPIPSHGGFNNFFLSRWNYRGTKFIKVNFHYGSGVGHIDYNYFLVDGLTVKPHLLMTYKGINFERTIANVNNDKFPDYYEHIFYDTGDKVFSRDSVAFIWREKDSVYVNTKNSRQVRPY